MSDERSKNTEASLQARIKNVAKSQGRSANDLFKQLYLERFLARLARSEHADQFIFKGGRLLAFLIDLGRETTDLDFMLTRLAAEEPVLREAFQEIAATPSDDGFAMTLVGIKPLVQAHMDYPGFRATIEMRLMNGKMRDRLQIHQDSSKRPERPTHRHPHRHPVALSKENYGDEPIEETARP